MNGKWILLLAAVIVTAGCTTSDLTDRTVTSKRGAVVCVDHLAAEVGAQILEQGGNAVDAAVAMGFALAVTHPQAGNIGGGGFMMIRTADNAATCIDYREKAPEAAEPTMFLKEDGKVDKFKKENGFLMAGVPGTPAGLHLAHERFGRLPWSALVEPAVRLAEEGFCVDADLAAAFERHEKKLSRYQSTKAAYFGSSGRPLVEGERLVQHDLAAVLARIRDRGPDGFYKGETAEELIRAVQEGGGIMSLRDLAGYSARERTPVEGSYRGVTIIGPPPPSSGGTILIEMLNIVSGIDLEKVSHGERLHYLAEAMRRAYRDRALHLGDIDFVSVPMEHLHSLGRAHALLWDIERSRAGTSRGLSFSQAVQKVEKEEDESDRTDEVTRQTTHFSVMDGEGNVVSNTTTLEQTFGGKAVAGSTGILLNNEMGDFNSRPGWTDDGGAIGTASNLIAPGKRMLSSMCPVILLRDKEPLAVLGSPGGRSIINTVLQVIINLVELELPPVEAVAAPRIHHQWFPDRISVEKSLPEQVRNILENLGHDLKESRYQGDCHLIVVDPVTKEITGVADRRIDGWAAAPRKGPSR